MLDFRQAMLELMRLKEVACWQSSLCMDARMIALITFVCPVQPCAGHDNAVFGTNLIASSAAAAHGPFQPLYAWPSIWVEHCTKHVAGLSAFEVTNESARFSCIWELGSCGSPYLFLVHLIMVQGQCECARGPAEEAAAGGVVLRWQRPRHPRHFGHVACTQPPGQRLSARHARHLSSDRPQLDGESSSICLFIACQAHLCRACLRTHAQLVSWVLSAIVWGWP